MPDRNAELLSKVIIFSDLKNDQDALQLLGQKMEIKEFEKGRTILKEGEVGSEFFVLIQGQVSVYKNTLDGDKYRIVILNEAMTPGFGEAGLIESEPRSATIVCDVPCRVLILSQKNFYDFCIHYPQWAVPILKKISLNLMTRLRQTSNDLMLLHKALMNEVRG